MKKSVTKRMTKTVIECAEVKRVEGEEMEFVALAPIEVEGRLGYERAYKKARAYYKKIVNIVVTEVWYKSESYTMSLDQFLIYAKKQSN